MYILEKYRTCTHSSEGTIQVDSQVRMKVGLLRSMPWGRDIPSVAATPRPRLFGSEARLGQLDSLFSGAVVDVHKGGKRVLKICMSDASCIENTVLFLCFLL